MTRFANHSLRMWTGVVTLSVALSASGQANTVTVSFSDFATKAMLSTGTLLDQCVRGTSAFCGTIFNTQPTLGPYDMFVADTTFLTIDSRFSQDFVGVTSSAGDENDRGMLFGFVPRRLDFYCSDWECVIFTRYVGMPAHVTLDLVNTDTAVVVQVDDGLGQSITGVIPSTPGRWKIYVNPTDPVALCGGALAVIRAGCTLMRSVSARRSDRARSFVYRYPERADTMALIASVTPPRVTCPLRPARLDASQHRCFRRRAFR